MTLYDELVAIYSKHRFHDTRCTCGFKYENLDTGVTISHPEHLATLACERAAAVSSLAFDSDGTRKWDREGDAALRDYLKNRLIAALGKVKR